MKTIILKDDPNDSWARVELYHWQHGELPPQDGNCKPLDEPAALRAMAEALERGIKDGDLSGAPAPFNICLVLRYAASKLAGGCDLQERKIPEKCRLVAHSTGEGWHLSVQDSDGETVAILEPPDSWPAWVGVDYLTKYGFAIE